jgi:hypothetical protein
MTDLTVREALNAAAAAVRADKTLDNTQRSPAGSKAYVHNMPWGAFLGLLRGTKFDPSVHHPTVTD